MLDDIESNRNSIQTVINLGYVFIERKNITIGGKNYMNSSQIFAGENSKDAIYKYGVIRYNVPITTRSNDSYNAILMEYRFHTIGFKYIM